MEGGRQRKQELAPPVGLVYPGAAVIREERQRLLQTSCCSCWPLRQMDRLFLTQPRLEQRLSQVNQEASAGPSGPGAEASLL